MHWLGLTLVQVKRVIGRRADDVDLQDERLPFKYSPNGTSIQIELVTQTARPAASARC